MNNSGTLPSGSQMIHWTPGELLLTTLSSHYKVRDKIKILFQSEMRYSYHL